MVSLESLEIVPQIVPLGSENPFSPFQLIFRLFKQGDCIQAESEVGHLQKVVGEP